MHEFGWDEGWMSVVQPNLGPRSQYERRRTKICTQEMLIFVCVQQTTTYEIHKCHNFFLYLCLPYFTSSVAQKELPIFSFFSLEKNLINLSFFKLKLPFMWWNVQLVKPLGTNMRLRAKFLPIFADWLYSKIGLFPNM